MNNGNFFGRQKVIVAFFVVFALLHLLIPVLNHYFFRSFAYYYGVYNFAFYDFAHFKSSPCPVLFDGTNATFMQDHFSLLFPLLSPLYWIFNGLTGTYTLILIQWAAIIFGGWTTYRLTELRTQNSATGLAAMTCYFLLYSRFSSYQSDCNLAIIGSALLPAFFYYFENRNRLKLWLVFGVLLITREDFSMLLAFVSLFFLLAYRKDVGLRKLAFKLFLVSSVFFIVIIKWIIPSLETETVKFALFNYSALGSTPGKALTFILTHPLESVKLLFINHLNDPAHDWQKFRYYLVFGLSGGVLFFLRPAYLIILIPVVTKKMFNDDPLRWTYETYYGAETASILPALVFMLISEFKSTALQRVLSVTVFVFTLATSVYCFKVSYYPSSFTKFEFFKPFFYEQNYASRELHQLMVLIPKNAPVCASGRLLPHLANREKIYYFPWIKDAEYICMSLQGDTWPVSPEEYNQKLQDIIKSGNWKARYASGNVVVFERANHNRAN